ncbi:hypothetical protein AB0M57_04500 [Streptomyces sp. NPDC051597]|uniref:hypothetical protein n=1 Tax=Streptomyces sp. NPDC051597 TaxID=3155049 RepID=UPI00342642C4
MTARPEPTQVDAESDADELAFRFLHRLDDDPAEPAEPFYVPGFAFHLGAKGGAWPATRRPVYRDWPDRITDLRLPEETP